MKFLLYPFNYLFFLKIRYYRLHNCPLFKFSIPSRLDLCELQQLEAAGERVATTRSGDSVLDEEGTREGEAVWVAVTSSVRKWDGSVRREDQAYLTDLNLWLNRSKWITKYPSKPNQNGQVWTAKTSPQGWSYPTAMNRYNDQEEPPHQTQPQIAPTIPDRRSSSNINLADLKLSSEDESM